MQLSIISRHIQLLFHRDVTIRLLDLVIASKEYNPLFGTKESQLVLSGLVKRGEIQSSDLNAKYRGEL